MDYRSPRLLASCFSCLLREGKAKSLISGLFAWLSSNQTRLEHRENERDERSDEAVALAAGEIDLIRTAASHRGLFHVRAVGYRRCFGSW